jgi:predicted transcriptional regulator
MSTEDQNKTLLELTVQIVSAHVGKNTVPANGLPALIEQVYNALKSTGQEPAPAPVEKQQPFVSAKRSIFPDYIICLEDGRKLKTLKRHLRSTYGLSPEQYRDKWGLPADYPMVAPNYAEHRSRLAKQLGLGRKAPEALAEEEVEEEVAPPPAPVVVRAAPEPRVKRAEPTAASVFAKFPAKAPEPTEAVIEEPLKKKRGRKPFSKQMTRSMSR